VYAGIPAITCVTGGNMIRKAPIAILLLAWAMPFFAETFTVVSIDTLKPFEPLIAEVFTSAGFEAEFSYEPYARLLYSMRKNLYQGTFFTTIQLATELPGIRAVPVPLYDNDTVAISVKPGIVVRSVEDLSRYAVAIQRGNPTQTEITKGIPVVDVASLEVEFQMLDSGRVDVILAPRALTPGLARRAGLAAYTVHEPPLLTMPLYFFVGETGYDALEPLTREFSKKVESGEWARELQAILDGLN